MEDKYASMTAGIVVGEALAIVDAAGAAVVVGVSLATVDDVGAAVVLIGLGATVVVLAVVVRVNDDVEKRASVYVIIKEGASGTREVDEVPVSVATAGVAVTANVVGEVSESIVVRKATARALGVTDAVDVGEVGTVVRGVLERVALGASFPSEGGALAVAVVVAIAGVVLVAGAAAVVVVVAAGIGVVVVI